MQIAVKVRLAAHVLVALPTINVMKSRRLIAALDASGQPIVSGQMRLVKGPSDVRFGSKADIATKSARCLHYLQ